MRVADGGFYDGVAKLITHHTSITRRNTHSICRKYYVVFVCHIRDEAQERSPHVPPGEPLQRRGAAVGSMPTFVVWCKGEEEVWNDRMLQNLGHSIGPWSVDVTCWQNGGFAGWFIDARSSEMDLLALTTVEVFIIEPGQIWRSIIELEVESCLGGGGVIEA